MQKGKVKKLVSERGFGFIEDAEGKELFFHRSALEGVEFESLNDGQEVEFDVEQGDKGPRAVNVHLVQ